MNTRRLLGSKMGHILAIFIYGTSSGSPLARVEVVRRLRRSLPKMVIRVSKGEPT